jgi:hypothetical protein
MQSGLKFKRKENHCEFCFSFVSFVCTYYIRCPGYLKPFGGLQSTSLKRLQPGKWLNDELVYTGLRYACFPIHYLVLMISRDWIVNPLLRQNPLHPPVFVFWPSFYAKLRYINVEYFCFCVASIVLSEPTGGLKVVERWHRKIDMSRQAFLVIPVNWNKSPISDIRSFAHTN